VKSVKDKWDSKYERFKWMAFVSEEKMICSRKKNAVSAPFCSYDALALCRMGEVVYWDERGVSESTWAPPS
jgi:hypothetical protein